MNETITTTMTRKQRFQLQDPSWVDGIDLNHANNIIKMYEKLPDYQKNIFIDHFEEFINMSDLALFFYTEAMRGHKQVIDHDGKLLNKHRQSGLWTRQSTIRSLFPRWSPLVLEEWIEPEIEYNAF